MSGSSVGESAEVDHDVPVFVVRVSDQKDAHDVLERRWPELRVALKADWLRSSLHPGRSSLLNWSNSPARE